MTILLDRINLKSAKIGIVGLGYVGLPLAMRFSEEGFAVTGFDNDETKVQMLARGESYIRQYPADPIRNMLDAGFHPTTDFSAIARCDAIILCLPTPLGPHNEPDLSYIHNTLHSILPHLQEGQLISLESTTYPGTTEEEIAPRLKARGLVPGENFHLVYSPEREDPANTQYHIRNIPKVVSGMTDSCLQAGMALYGRIVEQVVPVSSPRTAEMTKILENTQRLVNIALVNEVKQICDKMAIDPFEVVDAAATKPFGFVPYYPGPGVGGHCIPVDPLYLVWKARQYGIHSHFIELASEVNAAMPGWVVNRTAAALNARGKPLNGSRILILGLAYKSNVDDMRESPSAAIIDLLRQAGADVAFSDPLLPVFPRMRGYRFEMRSVTLTAEALQNTDAVILCTAHDAFDYALIEQHAPLIIDTRGRFRQNIQNVVRA